jgi:hypothetical protein
MPRGGLSPKRLQQVLCPVFERRADRLHQRPHMVGDPAVQKDMVKGERHDDRNNPPQAHPPIVVPDISDASAIPTKIYELTKEIMAAQSCALRSNRSNSI